MSGKHPRASAYRLPLTCDRPGYPTSMVTGIPCVSKSIGKFHTCAAWHCGSMPVCHRCWHSHDHSHHESRCPMRSSIVYWSNARISPALANHPIHPDRRFQYVPVTFDPEYCLEHCQAPVCENHDGPRCLCANTHHAPEHTVWNHAHGTLSERQLSDIPVPARRSVPTKLGKGAAPLRTRSAIGEDANAASSLHAAITLEPLAKSRARQLAYERAVRKLSEAHRLTLSTAADIVAHQTRNGRRRWAGCHHYTTGALIPRAATR